MSYDVYLTVQSGTSKPDEYGDIWDGQTDVFWKNYTSNCAPMWRDAGIDLAEWDKRPASEMLPVLAAAIDTLKANPSKYTAMNPDNRWGSYETVIPFLEEIRDACTQHDLSTVRISN